MTTDPRPTTCPCGSGRTLSRCCGLFTDGSARPETALELMRSRFTAFATGRYDYLQQTVSPALHHRFTPDNLAKEARDVRWKRLDIESVEAGSTKDVTGRVTFAAYYERDGREHVVRERSRFEKIDGVWLYTGGTVLAANQVVTAGPKPGRNAPCPCGSGKKYKKCCGKHR